MIYTYYLIQDGWLLSDFNPETCLRIDPEQEVLALKKSTPIPQLFSISITNWSHPVFLTKQPKFHKTNSQSRQESQALVCVLEEATDLFSFCFLTHT